MKNTIRHRFNQARMTYAQTAQLQRQCAEYLVQKLDHTLWLHHHPPASILDVGCGTGFVTQELIKRFPLSAYTLNDLSPEMLHQAQASLDHPRQATFLLGDFETCITQTYDLIISNLALQWAQQVETTLNHLMAHTTTLAFSTLIQGSFEGWHRLLKDYGAPPQAQHTYPTEYHLTRWLSSYPHACYRSQTKTLSLTLPNAYTVMQYWKKLGASAVPALVPFSVIKNLMIHHHDPVHLEYRMFFGLLHKKEADHP